MLTAMNDEEKKERRITRRRFLGAAAGALGVGGVAAGCRRAEKQDGPGLATPSDETPAPGATASATRPSGVQPGGSLRYTGFVIADDGSEGKYDPQKTQSAPFYGHQAMVYSRLLAYRDMGQGSIAADLAAALPEQPDAQTYVFRLNPAARWHDRAPLGGPPVTAEDVRFTLERQIQGDASFVRKAKWAAVESIAVSDPQTVTIRLKSPLAAMLGQFADVNSFVIAREAAERGFTLENQVGSGPFRWVEWSEKKFASVARNPAWHGGDGRPYLDGVDVLQPRDTSEVEAWLRTKKLDVAFVGRPQAEKLRAVIPALTDETVGQSRFFGMRFFTPQFPYSDQRFRSAVSYALDRREMLQKFFAGSGEVNPWISWPIKRWTLPQAELATRPGYRPGASGRADDLKEAKALLDAFKGEKELPKDPLTLLVVDEAEKNLGMGSIIKSQLKLSLDLEVGVYPVPAAELGQRLLTLNAPWAAGPDDGWVDLDDWVYPYFHSQGTKNTFPLRDAGIDALIESQRVELNEEKRQGIGYEIQRKLLELNVGVNFVSERVVALAWPYVRGLPLDAADGYQHRLADCWIDQGDPTFRGRQ
ncbi:MAG: ABC transporter substrate-binding protein [Chloroflexi bacterium CFX7]|nr:ABC transporter substrate-binding protein [Chloroflexi bacterium CFX7]